MKTVSYKTGQTWHAAYHCKANGKILGMIYIRKLYLFDWGDYGPMAF